MPIRFACPHCGQSLRARDDKVGRKLKCPKCRESLTVPAESPPAAGDVEAGGATDDPFSELIVYDDDVIYETEETPSTSAAPRSGPNGEARFEPRHVAVPRWILYAHAGLLALLAVVAFGVGLLIGGSWRDDSVPTARRQPVQVSGKLTWESIAEVGDKDAAIIIWPIGRTPQKKIAAASLLVDQPAPKQDDLAYQEILDLGGVYKRAQEGGRFVFDLMPGSYRVLLISRNAQRPGGTNPKPEDIAELGTIFTPPEAIVGRQKYQLSTIDLNQGSEIKHYFGENGKP